MDKKSKLNELIGKKIKLIFKYPHFNKFTYKRGILLEVGEDCFCVQEIKDGESTYGFSFLIEFQEVKE